MVNEIDDIFGPIPQPVEAAVPVEQEAAPAPEADPIEAQQAEEVVEPADVVEAAPELGHLMEGPPEKAGNEIEDAELVASPLSAAQVFRNQINFLAREVKRFLKLRGDLPQLEALDEVFEGEEV